MIEAMLLGRLKRPGAATAAVVGDRIHPDFVPEGWPLPAVFYRRMKTPTTYNTDGTIDHQRPVFEFACVAAQFEKAQALETALAICADFRQWSAVAEHETVHGVFVDDGGDQYDGEARRHVVTVRVEAIYTTHQAAGDGCRTS